MSYNQALPQVFPHVIVVNRHHVPRIAELLASADHRYANGSSFAVATNSDRGTVKLWLSDASLQRLEADDLWEHHVTGTGEWRLTCD